MKIQKGEWNNECPSFDVWHNEDGTVVSSMLRIPYTPRKFLVTEFLLEAVWTAGLLNVLLILGNLKL